MKKIKLGFAPTRRSIFSAPDAIKYRNLTAARLKELGIDMSVATMNAFALEKGLDKTFDQMSQGEQTMLRYQYLMSATADAQGDFSRTSDGYANSMRKLETNVTKLKTSLGKSFIDVVTDATGLLNGFIDLIYPPESQKSVIDRFNDIDIETEQKIADIGKIKAEADSLIDKLLLIGGSTNLDDKETEITNLLSMGSNSQEARNALTALGFSTDQIDKKQEEWLKTCKELVKTIPGLSEIINTETGEVTGGTGALREYVDEWKQAQEKLAYWKAYYAKEDALRETQNNIYGLEITAGGARRAAERAKEEIEKQAKKLGINLDWYEGHYDWTKIKGQPNMLTEEQKAYNKAIDDYYAAESRALTAENNYNNAVKDNASAIQILADEHDYLVGKYGEEEKAVTQVSKAMTTLEKAAEGDADAMQTVTDAVNAAKDALTEMADYAENVRNSVAGAVDSTVNGLEYIGNASARQAKRLEPLEKELKQLQEEGKETGDIELRIADETDVYSTQHAIKNLQSQLEFLQEYKADMEKAREMGFSNDFLAQFADGSVESAEWLHNLTNGASAATEEQIDQINDLYEEVELGKSELTDTLAAQQLSIDQTFMTLQEKAAEAVAKLDMEGAAADNAGKTVNGVVQGLASKLPEVTEQVDAILAQLNRLDGYSINIDFGGFGEINFTTTTGENAEGSARMGLFSVPHDDYLARLHEGERVLSAQEAQQYNSLLYGGYAGFDLDSLGGVMRDNIKAGGNVYLDGKVVGEVVSYRQGKSYKSLQRSGWQS